LVAVVWVDGHFIADFKLEIVLIVFDVLVASVFGITKIMSAALLSLGDDRRK